MTGGYLKVERNGKWENIEVEHLTDEEREKILSKDDRLIQWLNLVCNKIVEVELLLKDLEKDGVIQAMRMG